MHVLPPARAETAQHRRHVRVELFRIVAEESRRSRCLVIGEDLGTVPEEVVRDMVACGVYGYKPSFGRVPFPVRDIPMGAIPFVLQRSAR